MPDRLKKTRHNDEDIPIGWFMVAQMARGILIIAGFVVIRYVVLLIFGK